MQNLGVDVLNVTLFILYSWEDLLLRIVIELVKKESQDYVSDFNMNVSFNRNQNEEFSFLILIFITFISMG